MSRAGTLVTLALVCILSVTAATDATSVSNDAGWDSRFGAPGLSGSVYALKMSAGNVYAGGVFTTAGGAAANRIAMWDNASWSALGSGVTGDVYAIAIAGNDVYVGGSFTTAGGTSANRIARWNGSSWSALGIGVSGIVRAIAISGTDVYVGGSFTTAGGTTALRVARWNGSSWSALGVGPSADVNTIGIDGTNIYVGGTFLTVSGMGASRIARWNGSSWSALGLGMNGTVNAIEMDGSTVYVGGAFTTAGGSSAFRVARWSGASWSALGSGTTGPVNALAIDGTDLYVGGDFTIAGGLTAARIARWDGSSWSSIGSGTSALIRAVDAIGGDLHVGGDFTVAGTKPSFYFGRHNPAIVPIFITDFGAEPNESGVRLWWDILADEEVDEFRIYRRKKRTSEYGQVDQRDHISSDARTYTDTSVEFGATYEYVLGVARPDGSEVRSPAAEVKTVSFALKLGQNYPNPFNPTTTIKFTLPGVEHVTLAIVDAQGRIVTTLVDATLTAGAKEIEWDGTDILGNPVSSGVYFYRLRAGKTVQTRKMVLIK